MFQRRTQIRRQISIKDFLADDGKEAEFIRRSVQMTNMGYNIDLAALRNFFYFYFHFQFDYHFINIKTFKQLFLTQMNKKNKKKQELLAIEGPLALLKRDEEHQSRSLENNKGENIVNNPGAAHYARAGCGLFFSTISCNQIVERT